MRYRFPAQAPDRSLLQIVVDVTARPRSNPNEDNLRVARARSSSEYST